MLSYGRKLLKQFEKVLSEIMSCSKIDDSRQTYRLQIESAFISRISYEPFKISQIYRDKNKIYGKWLKEKLENIK